MRLIVLLLFTVTVHAQDWTEWYQLTVPAGIVDNPWLANVVDYDDNGQDDIILYAHRGEGALFWQGATGEPIYLDTTVWPFGSIEPVWIDVDGDGDLDGIGNGGWGISGYTFINDGFGGYSRIGDKDDYYFPAEDLAGLEWLIPPDVNIGTNGIFANLKLSLPIDIDNDGGKERVITVSGKDAVDKTLWHAYSFILDAGNNVINETLGIPSENTLLMPEDVNQDGRTDLIDLWNGVVYSNTLNGFFPGPDFLTGTPYNGDGRVLVIDIDNNGYRDLFFHKNHSNEWGAYLNDDGVFTEYEWFGETGMRRAMFADLDQDGDFDLINWDNASTITVYRNNTPNSGVFIPFDGDPYGQTVIVEKDGALVYHNTIIQHNRASLSVPGLNEVHVGGVSPSDNLTVTVTTGPVNPPDPPDYNLSELLGGLDQIRGGVNAVMQSLNVPMPGIESDLQTILDAADSIHGQVQ